MPKFALLIVCVMLWGCSPAKRLERLQRKHPYLFNTTTDTLKIIIPKVDTLYFHYSKSDTLVFKDTLNNTLETRYYFRDTFKVYYKSQPCTTIVKKQTIMPSLSPEPENDFKEYLYLIISIFALALLWKILN
jgi:hypothetical protein